MADKNAFGLGPLDSLVSEFETELSAAPGIGKKAEPTETPEIDVRRPTPAPSRARGLLPPTDLVPVFEAASQKYDVPVNVLMALAQQESSYDPSVRGQPTQYGRALGMMQYLPSTAKMMGINPFDTEQSIDAAARQLKDRLAKGYSMEDAVKEHFAGPDRRQWGPKTAQYGVDVIGKARQIGAQMYGDDPGAHTMPDLRRNPFLTQGNMSTRQDGPMSVPAGTDTRKLPEINMPAVQEDAKAADYESRNWFDRYVGDRLKSGVLGMRAGFSANIASNDARLIDIIERIDRGESVPEMDDPLGYQQMPQDLREKTKNDLAQNFLKNIGDTASLRKEQAKIPQNPDVQAALQSKTFSEFWDHFKKAPVTFITNVGVESAPAMVPGLLAGGAAGIGLRAGATGFAAGMGAGSYGVDYNASVLEALQDIGVDPTDKTALEKAFRSPDTMEQVRKLANAHASVVGALDAASGGVAGKSIIGGKTIARKAANMGAQTVVQGTLGAAGEAGGQIAQGKTDLDAGQIAAEFLGEAATAPIEVVGAGLSKAKSSGAKLFSRFRSKPAPSGPVGRASQAGEADAAARRVVVTAADGRRIIGYIDAYDEDGQGGFTARVLGDDGTPYSFSSADGVTITPAGQSSGGALVPVDTITVDSQGVARTQAEASAEQDRRAAERNARRKYKESLGVTPGTEKAADAQRKRERTPATDQIPEGTRVEVTTAEGEVLEGKAQYYDAHSEGARMELLTDDGKTHRLLEQDISEIRVVEDGNGKPADSVPVHDDSGSSAEPAGAKRGNKSRTSKKDAAASVSSDGEVAGQSVSDVAEGVADAVGGRNAERPLKDDISAMPLDELVKHREYLSTQARISGWDKPLTREKNRVETAIRKIDPAALDQFKTPLDRTKPDVAARDTDITTPQGKPLVELFHPASGTNILVRKDHWEDGASRLVVFNRGGTRKVGPGQEVNRAALAAPVDANPAQKPAAPANFEVVDALADKAMEVILDSGRVSLSAVQRHLKVGYNEVERLFGVLEGQGKISAALPDGTRTILARQNVVKTTKSLRDRLVAEFKDWVESTQDDPNGFGFGEAEAIGEGSKAFNEEMARSGDTEKAQRLSEEAEEAAYQLADQVKEEQFLRRRVQSRRDALNAAVGQGVMTQAEANALVSAASRGKADDALQTIDDGIKAARKRAQKTAIESSSETPVLAAPVRSETQHPEQKTNTTKASKTDLDHLFGVDQKREKALERIAKGRAWFSDQKKAADFITKNGLGDTHTVEQTGAKRFEVKAKTTNQQPSNTTEVIHDGDLVVAVNKNTGNVVDRGIYRGDDLRTGSARIEVSPGRISMRHRDNYEISAQKAAPGDDAGATVATTQPVPFDSAAFDAARDKVIKASREAGNTHLDKVPAYVETMRGKDVFYVHDIKVKGTIRTVDNRGNVYVDWADKYSADRELASPVKDGKKTVFRSSIGPNDLKDYALTQEVTAQPAPADADRGGARQMGPNGYTFLADDQASAIQRAFSAREVESLSIGRSGDGYLNFGEQFPDGRYRIDSADKVVGFDGKGGWKTVGEKTPQTGSYDINAEPSSEVIRVLSELGAKKKAAPVQPKKPVTVTKTPGVTTIVIDPSAMSGESNVEFIKALESARKDLPDGFAIQPERDSVALMENGKFAVTGLGRNLAGIQEALRQAKLRAEPSPDPVASSTADVSPEPKPADARFAKNKIFTADRVALARARLKSKLNQLNSGIDPEVLMDGLTITGAYVEEGVRDFSAYAKAMAEDFGDAIKPYLLSFWEGVRNYPGLNAEGMTPADEARAAHAALMTPADVQTEAVGEIVKKPAKRTRKTGSKADMTLTQDWGVDHIDGYQDNPDRETGNTTKDAFMKEARSYLSAVASILTENGYTPHTDAKGRPMKPVSVNESGVAGSGDISLTLAGPDGVGVYVHIGDSALRGVVPTTPSGIAIMFRAAQNGDRFGVKGANQWAPVDLSAADFAALVDSHVKQEAKRNERPTDAANAGTGAQGSRAASVPANEEPGTTGDLFGQPDDRGDAVDQHGDRAGDTGLDADRRSDEARPAGRNGPQDGRGSGAVPGAGSDADGAGRGRGRSERADEPVRADQRREPAERQPRPVSAPRNYRIQPGEIAREGSWKDTAERNVQIVELVKRLQAENRAATPDEKALLTKFTGWGASEIANGVFPDRYGNYKPGWQELGERLKSALTDEEYANARRSTQYAHYTSEGVIRSIYAGLDRLGFKGGEIAEPGMGIGLFAGLMPDAIAANSTYTGIEFDAITGEIAKQLYPASNIIIGDYTRTNLPGDYFDAAIGNPPFSSTVITNDPEYKRHRFMLHDYFFAKTIDRVRPGGLVVFVTSKGTMDKASDKARKYLAARANLIGAVRLPQTAFKGNAGTEVVTDVLFLQKRGPGVEDNGVSWLGLKEVNTNKGESTPVNEYFADHPEMVLGEHAMTGTMYRANEYTVEPRDGEDIEQAFAAAVQRLPENIFNAERGTKADTARVIERDYNPTNRKEGGLYLSDDGTLMQVQDGSGVQAEQRKGSSGKMLDLKPKQIEWLKSYVGVRDALKQAQHDQLTDGDWQASMRALNDAYDAFVKKHGPILAHSIIERENEDGTTTVTQRFKNKALWDMDAEGALVFAMENIAPDGTISKAPVFSERVLRRPVEPEIKTTQDAMFVSLNRLGHLDIDDVAKLAGLPRDEAIEGLGTAIYEDPGAGWQTADAYLSGNVVRKLEQARAAADLNPKFKRNIDALLAVQPRPLGPTDITVRLGANWVPASDIEAFAQDVLGERIEVIYTPITGDWSAVGRGSVAGSEWAAGDLSPSQILHAVLNSRQIKVTYKDGEGKTHTDPVATEKANDVAHKMKEAFARWIWTEPARADRLTKYYNENFNNIAPRQYDGSHLTLPGVSLRFNLHPHQKRAVWRVIQEGNTYLAHSVGSGKTISAVASIMEQRRLGLAQKPIVVVPNHMLAQFAREFLELYPTASIMVADEQNFHTSNRRRFLAQAALNNPDAIILTHSAFGRVGMSDEYAHVFIQRQIDEWKSALQDVDGADRITKKQIEHRIEQLERRLEGKQGKEKKDQVLTFEELGADMIYVDECFTYDTLVETDAGLLPIGDIVENELRVRVKSLNPETHAVEWKPVTNWYRHARRTAFIEVFHEHGSFICTPNHNIWTDSGYVKAGNLKAGTELRVLRRGIYSELHRQEGQEGAVLLAPMQGGGDDGFQGVSRVQGAVFVPDEGAGERREADVLLHVMCAQGAGEDARIHGLVAGQDEADLGEHADQGQTIASNGGADAPEQSDETAGSQSESIVGALGDGTQAGQAWRQRLHQRPTGDVGAEDGNDDRIRGLNEIDPASGGRHADKLQDRLGGHDLDGGGRSGRGFAQISQSEGEGCTQGSRPGTTRVVRIEVLQPGSDGEYRFCGRNHQTVYDIEVDGNHNYFANGVLVSNSHEFRKLDFATNQGNIKGIDPAGSQKALDLYMKAQYLRERRPGRNLVFMSGTPITNTMGELYTVQRFFQPEQMAEDGLDTFDAWAAQYGDTVTALEQNAAGGYETVTRFAKFQNVPELMHRVRSFMDIVTNSKLGELVKRPNVKGGARQIVVTPSPSGYKAYQKVLEARIKAIRARTGPPQPGDDIILNVITDGKFSAIDMRFVDPTMPADPDSKLNRVLDDLIEAYRATASNEYTTDGVVDPIKGSTLLVFSDIGLGDQAAARRGFSMRNWIEHRLTDAGIPREHIAFMRDYKQHAKKGRLFADMREGKKRILIGGKDMETGVNVQKRLTHIKHLDAPWFPSSVEQREGRGIRQGNQNAEVDVASYATKGSYDSTMWGMNARKARFIEQAMNGDDSVRSLEDVSEASSFEMAAALASGDERYLKLAGLRGDVERLGRLREAHYDGQNKMRRDRHWAESEIERKGKLLDEYKAAIAKRKPIVAGEFEGKIGKTTFEARDEFSNALFDAFKVLAAEQSDKTTVLGQIGGFDIRFDGLRGDKSYFADVSVDVPGADPILSYPLEEGLAINGLATKAANQVNSLDRRATMAEQDIANAKRRIEQIDARFGAPFAEEADLLDKVAQLNELEAELAAESKDADNAQAAQQAQVEPPSDVSLSVADQINTPAFRKWFGDSKVVDAEGNPLVVYHGSASPEFTRDGLKTEFGTKNGMGEGAYFTPDEQLASEYASMDAEVGDGNAAVIPVYLSIKNPKVMDNYSSQSISPEQKADLAAQGHDGVFGKTEDGKLIEIIAFRPEQIKSATGNNGGFDPNNPDITYSVSADGSDVGLSQRGTDVMRAQAPIMVRSTDAERAMSDTDLRAQVFSNLRDEKALENLDIGRIDVNRAGWSKSRANSADRAKLLSLSALPEIIRDGAYLGSRPLTKNKAAVGYHYIGQRVNVDGVPLAALVTIEERADGSLAYYNHTLLTDPFAQGKGAGNVDSLLASYRRPVFTPDRQRSRAEALPIAHDRSYRALLDGVLGGLVDTLIGDGHVVLHLNENALPTSINLKGGAAVQGWTDRDTGIIHLVGENLTPQTAVPVLMHEALHSGGERLIGTPKWNNLMRRADAMRRAAERRRADGRVKDGDFWDGALRRLDAAQKNGAVSPERLTEEFAAYAIEEYALAPSGIKKWVDAFIGMVKEWLYRRFGLQAGRVTPAQLNALAVAALRSMEGTQPVQTRAVDGHAFGSMAMSAQPVTDTPAFKQWFGNSKVVDAESKPLVVYHGTEYNFDEFAQKGGLGGAGGFWFASKPEASEVYAKPRMAGNAASIMPTYLSLKNPVEYADYGAFQSAVREQRGTDYEARVKALRRSLERKGNDGIIIRTSETDGGGQRTDFVAFRPEQIKSATGNRGTFDASSPNIMFSVTPDLKEATDALDSDTNYLEYDGLPDASGAAIRDMSSRYMKYVAHPRHIAALFKDFVPVFKAANDQQHYRNSTLEDLHKDYKAYDKLKQDAKERVNRILELGRLDGRVYTEAQLYNGVTNPGFVKTVVRDENGEPHLVRQPMQAALSKAGDVIKLNAAEIDAYRGLRTMFDKALDKFRDQALTDFGFGEFVGMADPLEALRKKVDGKPKADAQANRIRNAIQFIEDIEQSKRAGYVPFSRYGDYVIAVKERVADIKYETFGDGFLAHGTTPDLDDALERMGAVYDNEENAWYVNADQRADLERANERTVFSEKIETGLRDKFGKNSERNVKAREGRVEDIPSVKAAIARVEKEYVTGRDNRRIVSFETTKKRGEGGIDLTALDALAELAQIDNPTWDAVRGELQKALQAGGFRRHFFQSSHVPGYTTDFQRAIADYMVGMSGYLARRRFNDAWDTALAAIKGADLHEYSTKYRAYFNDPREEFAALRQAAFVMKIGANISSALVNLTQTFLTTIPTLNQIAGNATVAAELAKASKDALAMVTPKSGTNVFDMSKAPADLREEFAKADAAGLFLPLNSFDLMGQANQRTARARKIQEVANTATSVISLPFSASERFNRIVAFTAAARLAKRPDMAAKIRNHFKNDAWARESFGRKFTPYDFAEWLAAETQFQMGKINRPTMMRGAGAAMLQFKSFMLQLLEKMYRDWNLHGAAGKISTISTLAMMVAFSGLWGAPGADDLRKLLEFLYKQATGKSLDMKDAMRQAIYGATGSMLVTDALSSGLPYHLGADLSRRVGMGNIMPEQFNKTGLDTLDMASMVGGPGFDLLVAAPIRAIGLVSAGNVSGAVGELSPVWAKNPMQAYQWYSDAVRTKKGDKVLDRSEISGADIALKAIGVQPSRVSRQYEMSSAQYNAQRGNDDAKRSLRLGLVRAMEREHANKDQGNAAALRADVDAAVEKIREWNRAAAPDQRISLKPSSVRAMMQRERLGGESVVRRAPKAAREAATRRAEAYGIGLGR